MDKRDFIKTLAALLAGSSIPANAKTETLSQEERELVMTAALSTPEGEEALRKVINECDICGKIHEMMLEAAGSEEELKRIIRHPDVLESLLQEEEQARKKIMQKAYEAWDEGYFKSCLNEHS